MVHVGTKVGLDLCLRGISYTPVRRSCYAPIEADTALQPSVILEAQVYEGSLEFDMKDLSERIEKVSFPIST